MGVAAVAAGLAKVASVVSDLLGLSVRAVLRGLIEGETDPDQLLARMSGRLFLCSVGRCPGR